MSLIVNLHHKEHGLFRAHMFFEFLKMFCDIFLAFGDILMSSGRGKVGKCALRCLILACNLFSQTCNFTFMRFVHIILSYIHDWGILLLTSNYTDQKVVKSLIFST